MKLKKLAPALFLGLAVVSIAVFYFGEIEVKQDNDKEEIATTSQHKKNTLKGKLDLDDQPKVELQCDQFIKEENIDDKWLSKQYDLLSQKLKELQSSSNEYFIDYIAFNSGIGARNGRLMRDGYRASPKKPLYYEGDAFLAMSKEEAVASQFINNKNVFQLQQYLDSNPEFSRTYFAGEKHPVFFIGNLIEKDTKKRNELINLALDTNIEPTYADLAMATKDNIDLYLVEKMHRKSYLTANKILSAFGYKYSLATIAIAANNFELSIYWINEGSPLEPDEFALNALDLLFKYNKNFKKEEVLTLSKLMLEKGVYPNHSKTVESLKNIYSKDEFHLYENNLKQTFKLSEFEKLQADKIIFQMQSEIIEEVVSFDPYSSSIHPCHGELSKLILKKVAIHHRTKKQETPKKIAPQNISQKQDKLIEKAKLIYSNEEDIERFLDPDNTIEGKSLVEHYRKQEISKKAREARENNNLDEQFGDIASLEDAIELAKQGRWGEAEKLLISLGVNRSEALSILLSIALNTNASKDIIIQFMEEGASLQENAISILIARDDATLANALLPYGLNINYIDLLHYTPVINSVRLKAPNMLAFLIKNGSIINTNWSGFDALDFALQQFDIKVTKGYYVDTLLKSGANIEPSHKQWVEGKQSLDFDSYIYLISHYPELAQ